MKLNTNTNVFNRQWLAQPNQAQATQAKKPVAVEKPDKVSATAKVMRELNANSQEAVDKFVPERTLSGLKKGQLVDIRV